MATSSSGTSGRVAAATNNTQRYNSLPNLPTIYAAPQQSQPQSSGTFSVVPSQTGSYANSSGLLGGSAQPAAYQQPYQSFSERFPNLKDTISKAPGSLGGGSMTMGATSVQKQMVQAELDMMNLAIQQAKRGAPMLMPSKQAYTAAMNAAVGAIEGGLNQANTSIGEGMTMSQNNLNSAIKALQDNYGIGIQELKNYAERGATSINDSTAAAQQYLTDALSLGQNALDPYTSMAPEAVNDYNDFVNRGFADDYQAFIDSPVYQLQLTEGQKAMERSAAARGTLQSGAMLKDLDKFASDYAAQQYFNYNNNRYGQLADRATMGLNAVNSLANLGATVGTSQADVAQRGGLALADLMSGTGQAVGGLYGDLGTRQAVSYGDFSNIQAGLLSQKAQQQIAAANAIAEQKKSGILGAGQKVYYTNQFNNTF